MPSLVPKPSCVGPYQLLERLGRGAMGAVYLAHRGSDGERVAVKTVHGRDEYRVRALRAEIHALERLRHPGIVRLIESGLDNGVPWYAMELLSGPSLRDRLRTEPESTYVPLVRDEAHASPTRTPPPDAASIRELIDVVARICEPLSFLHGEGLVHRDLKPENIYFRPDGYPVLIDFGLAMRFGGATARDVLEFGGRAEGTLSYMAPEQLRGELVDARGDLYSLGCILYESATGRVPFPGGNWDAAPPPILDEVPEPARAVVARLLSERPSGRFGYASDVATRLGRGRAVEPPARDAPRSREYLYRSRFIGRETVLAELRAELERVSAGRGRLMCITAPTGAGKTRLVVELGTLAGLSGFRVVAGECSPHVAVGSETPRSVGAALHPLRPFFRLVADGLRDQPPERLVERFGVSLAFLALFEPGIASLLPTPAELPPSPTRAQVLEHVAATLLEVAREQPLLIVLDDLQWADDLTLAVVSLLAEMSLDGVPLALVGTYRIEDAHGALELLSNADRCREFRLRQLSVDDVDTLVSDMLALSEPPPAWVRELVEKSGGNPFFVAESLRCAVDEQRLRRDADGRWIVVAGVGGDAATELPFSSTLEQLIVRRLESLPVEAGALLELSSVFGRELSKDWLAAASAPAGAEIGWLDELLLRQVLEEPSPGQLRFSHQKLQEMSHARLLAPRRRALHGIVARVLESSLASGVEHSADAAALAAHWELAGELDRTRLYLERAGAQALHVGAHADASRHLERLLALPTVPGSRSDPSEPRFRRMLADARFGLGDIGGCVEHGSRVFELLGRALPSSDLGWLAFLARQTSTQVWHLALTPTVEVHDPVLHEAAMTAERLAESHYFRDRSIPMAASVLLAVNLAERGGGQARMSPAYAKLGYLAGLMRADRLGRRYFELAERLALSADDRAGLASAHYTHALHHLGFARWVQAREHALSALAALTGLGDRHQTELAETMLAQAEFYSGNPQAAFDRFSAIRSSARARSNRQHEAWGAYAMARSQLELGDFEQARVLIEEAQQLLERHPDRASSAICSGLRARVHWGQGQAQAALAQADATLERLRTTLPTAFSMLSAFTGAAECYLLHWEQVRRPIARGQRHAREICRQLERFARVFPMAGPASARCSAWLTRLQGRPRPARRALEGSLRLAVELGMPLESRASAALLARG